jgi:hypothetical protein
VPIKDSPTWALITQGASAELESPSALAPGDDDAVHPPCKTVPPIGCPYRCWYRVINKLILIGCHFPSQLTRSFRMLHAVLRQFASLSHSAHGRRCNVSGTHSKVEYLLTMLCFPPARHSLPGHWLVGLADAGSAAARRRLLGWWHATIRRPVVCGCAHTPCNGHDTVSVCTVKPRVMTLAPLDVRRSMCARCQHLHLVQIVRFRAVCATTCTARAGFKLA